jgi:hypothetical protein
LARNKTEATQYPFEKYMEIRRPKIKNNRNLKRPRDKNETVCKVARAQNYN